MYPVRWINVPTGGSNTFNPKTLSGGSTEHLLIVTHPGACLQVQVAYASHGGSYRARGKTGPKGMWRHNWVVMGPRGYTSVHITALFGASAPSPTVTLRCAKQRFGPLTACSIWRDGIGDLPCAARPSGRALEHPNCRIA
jgi:hypothetical protein